MSGAEAALRAARLGDEITHGWGLLGMVSGALLGAVVGAVVVSATVATGGLALLVIGGCIAGGGLAMGQLVKGIARAANLPGPASGRLSQGSPNVTVNGRKAMRAGVDYAPECSGLPLNHFPQIKVPIAQGARTVRVNGQPMARTGMRMACGAQIKTGSGNVFVGGPTATVAPIRDNEAEFRQSLEMLGLFAMAGGLGAAMAAGAMATAAFVGIAGGMHYAFKGLRTLGDSLGPGWGDIFEGAGQLALMGAGAKLATATAAPARAGHATRSAEASGRSRRVCECAADPVEVASGEFMDWRTDIEIPGVLPLELRRTYASRRDTSQQPGLFGPRWLDSWGVCLRRADASAHTTDYLDEEGVALVFETPCKPGFDSLEAEHLRAPHLVLRGTRQQPVLHDRERGVRLHFEWHQSTQARLSGYSDAHGNRIDFVYGIPAGSDPARPVRLRHSDGWEVRLLWNGTLQSAWLHEPGHRPVELVRYRHDELGRLQHSASQASGRLGYAYDARHRIVSWSDDSRTRTHLTYDEAGRVVAVRTPGGLHDGRFEYDEAARITRLWEAEPALPGLPPSDPHCTTFHYNEDGLVTRKVDPLGHATLSEWSPLHQLLSRKDALGRATRYLYDKDSGRLLRIVGSEGQYHGMAYDEEGRLLSLTDAQDRTVSRTYTAESLLARETQANGSTVHFEYDARGRLRRQRRGASVDEYHYDAQHRPCGHTAPNGAHTAWQQDLLGRLAWRTDALGARTTFEYESGGYPEAPGDEPPVAGGHARPVRTVLADGSAIAQRHDREGLPAEHTDALGHVQRWEWGAFDTLLAHTDAKGHGTRYRYGLDARLRELTNAAGQHWRWHYDAAGHLAEQTDYAGRRTRWQRDAVGRPLVRTTADGSTLHYEWDRIDRLRAVEGREGGQWSTRIGYAWDHRNQLASARVWRQEPGVSVLESETLLDYDPQGRLLRETHRSEGGPARSLGYRYDEQGQLIGRDGPLGSTQYRHDEQGWLRELHTAHGAVLIDRDALGRETGRIGVAPELLEPLRLARATSFELPSHLRLQQRHDKLGRLVHQAGFAARGAQHDAGRILQRDYHWQHDRLAGLDDIRFGRVRWQLDERGQILDSRCDTSRTMEHLLPPMSQHPQDARLGTLPEQERFRYDAAGNLGARGEQPVRYQADTVAENGPWRYDWDGKGRLLSRTLHRNGFRPSTWRYEWDAFDRLREVVTPEGQRWRYLYDAFGRRCAKRCVSPWSRPSPHASSRRQLRQADYLWDGPTLAAQWKVFADGTSEAPAFGQPQFESSEEVQEWHFEPGGFKPLAVAQQRAGQAAQLMHVVSGLNGAPRELLGNDGELLWAARLDTWGRLADCRVKDLDRAYAMRFSAPYRPAANDPVVDVDLRFANQWQDDESGLYYNLNRYYDPDTAGYASQDPLGPVEGGARTHGYVHNPITWIDPLGLNGCPGGEGTSYLYRGVHTGHPALRPIESTESLHLRVRPAPEQTASS